MTVRTDYSWNPEWDKHASFKPRPDEEHLYAACLLVHGVGPKFDVTAGSNQSQIDAGMQYGKEVDGWWVDNVCSKRDTDVKPMSVWDQAYAFRRRFLHWCREKNDDHT